MKRIGTTKTKKSKAFSNENVQSTGRFFLFEKTFVLFAPSLSIFAFASSAVPMSFVLREFTVRILEMHAAFSTFPEEISVTP